MPSTPERLRAPLIAVFICPLDILPNRIGIATRAAKQYAAAFHKRSQQCCGIFVRQFKHDDVPYPEKASGFDTVITIGGCF